MERAAETNGAQGHGASQGRADAAAPSADSSLRARQERLLDEGLEETFPASDPVAIVRLA